MCVWRGTRSPPPPARRLPTNDPASGSPPPPHYHTCNREEAARRAQLDAEAARRKRLDVLKQIQGMEDCGGWVAWDDGGRIFLMHALDNHDHHRHTLTQSPLNGNTTNGPQGTRTRRRRRTHRRRWRGGRRRWRRAGRRWTRTRRWVSGWVCLCGFMVWLYGCRYMGVWVCVGDGLMRRFFFGCMCVWGTDL